MLDEIVDLLQCFADLGSCHGSGTRWYGRTRPIRIMLIANRVVRRLCILLGLAGLVLLDPEAPLLGWLMIGAACAIPVLTLIPEFILTGRGGIVPGPPSWPPRPPKR